MISVRITLLDLAFSYKTNFTNHRIDTLTVLSHIIANANSTLLSAFSVFARWHPGNLIVSAFVALQYTHIRPFGMAGPTGGSFGAVCGPGGCK